MRRFDFEAGTRAGAYRNPGAKSDRSPEIVNYADDFAVLDAERRQR